MAKKRALVDAVLSATRSSAIFTQDIEDININLEKPSNQPIIPETKPIAAQSKDEAKPTKSKPASDKQLGKIYHLAKEMGMPNETAKQLLQDRYGVENSKQLTNRQASDFIKHLMEING